MVLAGYLIASCGLAFIFLKFTKKHLHALEIFVGWCLSSLIFQNYSAIQTMNLKSAVIPAVLSLEFANFTVRTVLYPVLTIMFLNHYALLKHYWMKGMAIIGFAALMTGMEELSDLLHVFIKVSWKLEWSYIFWLSYILILLLFGMFSRRKLYG